MTSPTAVLAHATAQSRRLASRGAQLTGAGLLAVPFAAGRLQASMIDRHLVQRLSKYSRARIISDALLGSVDCWAGAVLHQRQIEAAGRARLSESHERTRRRLRVMDTTTSADKHPPHNSYAL